MSCKRCAVGIALLGVLFGGLVNAQGLFDRGGPLSIDKPFDRGGALSIDKPLDKGGAGRLGAYLDPTEPVTVRWEARGPEFTSRFRAVPH